MNNTPRPSIPSTISPHEVRLVQQETGDAWNKTGTNYERDEAEQIALLRAGGSTLLEPERRLLGDISSWCGRAIHLRLGIFRV
jgi:hypothetical protein